MQIEGRNPVKEALESGKELKKILIAKGAHDLQPIVDKARSAGIPIQFAERVELDRVGKTGRHQGVIALCGEYRYHTMDEIVRSARSSGQPLFLLLLDGIEDPHNLGSILRVAECCGVHGVVIPKRRSAEVNETVLRVSAGAANYVKVAQVGNLNDAIRTLKDDFVGVYCADMDGKPMYDVPLTGDLALVIGGEGEGVKALTRKLCDGALSIPQYGKVNSLNASVACGVMCYEAVRQRNRKS